MEEEGQIELFFEWTMTAHSSTKRNKVKLVVAQGIRIKFQLWIAFLEEGLPLFSFVVERI